MLCLEIKSSNSSVKFFAVSPKTASGNAKREPFGPGKFRTLTDANRLALGEIAEDLTGGV